MKRSMKLRIETKDKCDYNNVKNVPQYKWENEPHFCSNNHRTAR